MLRWFKILAVLGLAFPSHQALAEMSSSSYSIGESFIGGGGLIEESSTNYKAAESIGDTGVGRSSSTNYQINSGYTTTTEPGLAFTVAGGTDFPPFSKTAVSAATATFSAKNYTSYGYVVLVHGTTPKNEAHNYSLPALASNDISRPGTEQYGINVVANSGFGANPVQNPSSSFSSGRPAANYNTADSFRFVSGEMIAEADKSSGVTDYTLSFIANVKGTTPAGTFTAGTTLICVATY